MARKVLTIAKPFLGMVCKICVWLWAARIPFLIMAVHADRYAMNSILLRTSCWEGRRVSFQVIGWLWWIWMTEWVTVAGLWVSAQSKAIPRVRWRLMVNKYVIGQCPIIQTRRSTCFLPEHCFLTETSKYVPRALTQSFTAYFILGLIYLGSGALVSSARWWRGWAAQTSSEILRMADDGIV